MNKDFDRKPETERLIAFLAKDTEIRLIEYDELVKVADSSKCKVINDIRPYLHSARRVLRDKHDVKYGTVRGVGIQRMNADEVSFYGKKRFPRGRRHFTEGLKDNATIAGSNTLSKEARAVLEVNNVMFTKLIHEIDGVKKMVKVAAQNDAEGLAAIIEALKKDKK